MTLDGRHGIPLPLSSPPAAAFAAAGGICMLAWRRNGRDAEVERRPPVNSERVSTTVAHLRRFAVAPGAADRSGALSRGEDWTSRGALGTLSRSEAVVLSTKGVSSAWGAWLHIVWILD